MLACMEKHRTDPINIFIQVTYPDLNNSILRAIIIIKTKYLYCFTGTLSRFYATKSSYKVNLSNNNTGCFYEFIRTV